MDKGSAADWMTNLPEELKTTRLSELAIPGSHDSGANNLTNELAPDSPNFVRALSRIPPLSCIVDKILKKWSVCQALSIKEQLNRGIRYLDLRVSSKSNEEMLYLVHSFYGPKVVDVFREVKEFLVVHPGEIVILDFNHFYEMDEPHHMTLISLIKSSFGSNLCARSSMQDLTLKNLRENHTQVICIYQHIEAVSEKYLWTKGIIISPWANTTSPEVCMERLTGYMEAAERDLTQFVACQSVLTPDTAYVVEHLLTVTSLRQLNQQLKPLLFPWLAASPGRWGHQPNIVLQDFVGEDDFIQLVLDLNKHRIPGRGQKNKRLKMVNGCIE